MANGLKPIGESIKPIIERIKKEREERRKRKGNKPIRTQPKLPGMKKGGKAKKESSTDEFLKRRKKLMGIKSILGMKKGGSTEPKYTVKDEVKDRMRKETPRTGYGVGLSPLTQYRRYKHKKNIKKQRARDDAKVNKKAKGGSMENPGVAAALQKLGRAGAAQKSKDPNKDKRSPGRPGGRGKKEDKRRKRRYMTPAARAVKKAEGGIAFGGEKRIPGSGAAFRGTGFKGIF